MTAATGDSLSFGYDALKRLNRVTAKSGSSIIMNTAYAYRDVSWNRGSAQVEFRNVRLGSDSGMLLEGKKYVYDDVGNLKEIRESTGDFSKLVEYAYDSQNQLTSEAYYKSGEAKAYLTYYYTYDTAGNLLTVSQKKGNTTTLLQTYTYGDAQWHDLLTAVNGQAITYDASGNPLSYGGWSFGWQNGRQLKTASKTSDGKTETLEYSYDADGIRTSKTYTVETFTQVPDYTVTFTADGATVKTMTVEDGYTLKDSDYPAVPTKTGYTGEWVKYTSAIHSNVTVQAKYTAVVTKYTVTFKADNTVVKTMTVKDGYTLKASDYPTVPAKSGYTGEWVKYTAAIHSDITINAVYEPSTVIKQYTVVFRADAKVLKTMKVEVGYTLQDSDYPEIPAKEGYTGHWDKSTTRIIKNTIINVIYSDNSSHVVTFIFDGVQIGTLTVTDGYVLKNSDYPSPFAPVGYIVTWEKYTLPIHSDITVTGKLQSDVTIPPQPTGPGEIMSGGEGEPVEADVPAEDEAVSPQGTHVTGTQTVTHEYLTLNGKVARETIRTNNTLTAVLDFIYDESGKPFALKYSTNGTSFETYYYVLNLQGDVVKLIHYIPGFEYESVATYEYDAWGNVSSSGRLAEINPLRYRGYYYDNETGFYYLQSRYYDPANRRFINADSLASTGQGSLGTNMFAYCNNCPTIYHDPSGHAISPLTNNRTAIREGDYGKSNKRPGPRSNAARDELISYFESLTPAYNIEDYYGAPSNINITVEYDDIYEKRNHATRDRVIGGASLVVGIIGLFCSAPIITILGAGLSAAGEISANSNDADPVPEGDFDGYIVTVTWDIPYIELPSSSNTPRLTGYSAQYYVIYCDSFREPFWAIIDYSLFEVYG